MTSRPSRSVEAHGQREEKVREPSSALRSMSNRHHVGTDSISLPILLNDPLSILPEKIIVPICRSVF